MPFDNHRRGPTTCHGLVVGALLFLASATGWSTAAAQGWTEFGPDKTPPKVASNRIAEPMFAFLTDLAEGDSLGVWTGEDVIRYAAAADERSRFPLKDVVSIRRMRPSSAEIARWPGVRVVAHWDLVLTRNLDRPMPYNILGYHPGSLLVSGHLELVELLVGSKELAARDGQNEVRASFEDIRVFALSRGHMVLDVDGLIDRILGSALDDAWTVGLVTAKEGGRRLGLGVSLGRGGRRIYGEIDLARDKVLPHGRPAMSALSGFCRQWLDPGRGLVPQPWTDLEHH